MPVNYPFKNLVFQGGGMRTFAYHGAIRVLEEYGILPQIERVAGTSAGAMMATFLSFGLSVDDTIALFDTIDFSKIPQRRTIGQMLERQPPRLLERESVNRLVSNVDSANRFIRKYGWYASDYAYTWLQDIIAEQCGGNGLATFADFKARGFRDVHIVATNISKRASQIFSAQTTPDVAVARALRMSESIPLFFEALRFDGKNFGSGDFFADGGVLNNFPLHIFDHAKYRADNPWFRLGINWETLGLRVYTPKDCPQQNERPIANIIGYIENLFMALVEAQIVAFNNDEVDQQRSISMSDCCVSLIDFNFTTNAADPKYRRLVESGRQATIAYLESYQPPLNAWQSRVQNWFSGTFSRKKSNRKSTA